MGRKSFDEIGHALPYCTIIIVSKTLKTAPEKCLLAQNLKQAFSFYDKNEEVLVAGGGEIYHQLMEETTKETLFFQKLIFVNGKKAILKIMRKMA